MKSLPLTAAIVPALCFACGPVDTAIQAEPLRPAELSLAAPARLANARATSAAGEQREAAVSLAKQSQITFLRNGGPAPHDLVAPLPGNESTIEADLDGDGHGESVYTFTAPDGMVYLSWRDGSTCHLSWGEKGFSWQVQARCGEEEGALVCLVDEVTGRASCDRCDNEACHQCETRGLEVYCP